MKTLLLAATACLIAAPAFAGAPCNPAQQARADKAALNYSLLTAPGTCALSGGSEQLLANGKTKVTPGHLIEVQASDGQRSGYVILARTGEPNARFVQDPKPEQVAVLRGHLD